MTTILLTRGDDGKITGIGEKMARAWKVACAVIKGLKRGDTIKVSVTVPRNSKFHRLHFAMLGALFDAQEQFEDMGKMRMYLTVGAGHCDLIPGPAGRMVAIPKSISYESLEEIEFGEVHKATKAFMRSERCLSFFWPHLTPAEAGEMIEGIIGPFEDGRNSESEERRP